MFALDDDLNLCVVRNRLHGYQCFCSHFMTKTKQESPPAWTQAAYRPPRSMCTLCCSNRGYPPVQVQGQDGGGTPIPGQDIGDTPCPGQDVAGGGVPHPVLMGWGYPHPVLTGYPWVPLHQEGRGTPHQLDAGTPNKGADGARWGIPPPQSWDRHMPVKT